MVATATGAIIFLHRPQGVHLFQEVNKYCPVHTNVSQTCRRRGGSGGGGGGGEEEGEGEEEERREGGGGGGGEEEEEEEEILESNVFTELKDQQIS